MTKCLKRQTKVPALQLSAVQETGLTKAAAGRFSAPSHRQEGGSSQGQQGTTVPSLPLPQGRVSKCTGTPVSTCTCRGTCPDWMNPPLGPAGTACRWSKSELSLRPITTRAPASAGGMAETGADWTLRRALRTQRGRGFPCSEEGESEAPPPPPAPGAKQPQLQVKANSDSGNNQPEPTAP